MAAFDDCSCPRLKAQNIGMIKVLEEIADMNGAKHCIIDAVIKAELVLAEIKQRDYHYKMGLMK